MSTIFYAVVNFTNESDRTGKSRVMTSHMQKLGYGHWHMF